MVGFKPRISGAEGDLSNNFATITGIQKNVTRKIMTSPITRLSGSIGHATDALTRRHEF